MVQNIIFILLWCTGALSTEIKHYEGQIHSNTLDGDAHQLMFHQIGHITKEVHHLHLSIPVDINEQIKAIQNFQDGINTYLKKSLAYNRNKETVGERAKKRLDEIKHQIETTLMPLEVHTRNKRQALIVAGGVLGGTLGLANALSHTPKIVKLNNEVNEIQVVNDQLLANGAIEDEEIHNLQVQVGNLTEMLKRVEVDNPSLFQSHCSHAISNAQQVRDRLIKTVESLGKKRLSPSLLKKDALQEFHKQLQHSAEALGFQLSAINPLDLYKLEASAYVTNNYTIVIVLNVPMMKKDDLLPLFKYVPFPLSQTMGMKASITPNLGDRDLIAATWKSGEQIYKVYSPSDLLNCQMMDATYICPESNHFHTHMEESCIGSLFTQNEEGVLRNCEFDIHEEKEHVFAISSQEFLIYSLDTYRTAVECEENSYEVNIGPLSHHKLPGGCVLKLRRHTIRADTYWNTTEDIVRIQWKWDLKSLFPTVSTEVLPKIISHYKSKGSKVLTARDIQKWQFDNDNNPILPQHNTIAMFIIIACCLIVPVSFCICFQFSCKRGKSITVQCRPCCVRKTALPKRNKQHINHHQFPLNPHYFVQQPVYT